MPRIPTRPPPLLRNAATVAALVLALTLAACASNTPTRPETPERPTRELPAGMADMRDEMAANRGETRDRMDDMMSGGEEAPDPNARSWLGPVLDAASFAAKIFTIF